MRDLRADLADAMRHWRMLAFELRDRQSEAARAYRLCSDAIDAALSASTVEEVWPSEVPRRAELFGLLRDLPPGRAVEVPALLYEGAASPGRLLRADTTRVTRRYFPGRLYRTRAIGTLKVWRAA